MKCFLSSEIFHHPASPKGLRRGKPDCVKNYAGAGEAAKTRKAVKSRGSEQRSSVALRAMEDKIADSLEQIWPQILRLGSLR
jgi:hypothetical protein